MSTFLRSPWLSRVVEHELSTGLDELETYVPGTHVKRNQISISPGHLEIVIRKKQNVQVIGEILIHEGRFRATISDGTGCLPALFELSCTDLYQAQFGRSFRNVKGGLLALTEYRLVLNAEREPLESLHIVVTMFKVLGSEGSRTFGEPVSIAIGRIRELCTIIVDVLDPSSDSEMEDENAVEGIALSTQLPFTLISQTNFKTQVVLDDGSSADADHEVMAEEDHPKQPLKPSGRRSQSIALSHSRSSTPRLSRSPHDDEVPQQPDQQRPASIISISDSDDASSRPVSRSSHMSSLNGDIKEESASEDGAENENARESHVKVMSRSDLSSLLPFVDNAFDQDPFVTCKRVPRKYARIPRDQQSLLESSSWFRKGDESQHLAAIMPASVTQSLEDFIATMEKSYILADNSRESEAESESDMAESDGDINALPQLHISSPLSIASSPRQLTDGDAADDGYDTEISSKSDIISPTRHDLPLVNFPESSHDLESAAVQPDLLEENSYHQTELELAVPVAVGGFSSDAIFGNDDEENVEEITTNIDVRLPSTAVNKRTVIQVERTPYVHGIQKDSAVLSHHLSSDPLIPATNIDTSTQPMSNPADSLVESVITSTEAVIGHLDDSNTCNKSKAEADISSFDSTPIRIAPEESRVSPDRNADQVERLSERASTESVMEDPEQTCSSPGLDGQGTPEHKRPTRKLPNAARPRSMRPMVRLDALKKRALRKLNRNKPESQPPQEENALFDTKLICRDVRHQFIEQKNLEDGKSFQTVRHDPELIPLVALSDELIPADSEFMNSLSQADVATQVEESLDKHVAADHLSLEKLLRPGNSASRTKPLNIQEDLLAAQAEHPIAVAEELQSSASDTLLTDTTAKEFQLPVTTERVGAVLDSTTMDKDPGPAPAQESYEDFQASITSFDDVAAPPDAGIPVKIEASSNPDSPVRQEDISTQDVSTSGSAPQPIPDVKIEFTEPDVDLYSVSSQSQSTQHTISRVTNSKHIAQQQHSSDSTILEVQVRGSQTASDVQDVDATGHNVKEHHGSLYDKFCAVYDSYTGDTHDFTLALVYIEYLFANGLFGHSHMCDDFIRFYPEDYLALGGDKLRISGWDLFKRKVRRPEFEEDVISSDNIEDALASLDSKEVEKIRSKYRGQDQRLYLGPRRTSTPRSVVLPSTEVVGKDVSASEDEPNLKRAAIEPHERADLFPKPISPPRKVPTPRQPFFQTASQQPPKRKASPENVTPRTKRRRILPWTPKQDSRGQSIRSAPQLPPPASMPHLESPILGDPNIAPRSARSHGMTDGSSRLNVSKKQHVDRRSTLATATVLEKPAKSVHPLDAEERRRIATNIMLAPNAIFRSLLAKSVVRRKSLGSDGIGSPNSSNPGASPGGRGISLKLKTPDKWKKLD